MTYVDHYEIEVKIGGRWTFIASKYPDYKWTFTRPWYRLWLCKMPTIAEPVCPALCARLESVVAAGEFAYTVRPHTPARVWQINRCGYGWLGLGWLRKRLSWSTPDGSLR